MKAELIDKMGDDLRVVNAARVSFAKEHKEFEGNDAGLIKYLATHNHWTPFGHVIIQMRETVPIFVARQRFKHTIGFNYEELEDGIGNVYNEESRRYVSSDPTFFVPDVWRKAAENKKQGSSDEVITHLMDYDVEEYNIPIGAAYKSFLWEAANLYDTMIAGGVAPEQARMVLPQSMYTSYYVTGSLAAWARAYKLRIDPHAQKEIQDLAKQWDDIISAIPEMKYSWEALTKEA